METVDQQCIERFLAYAEAFESAFNTDDWTVLEPFFTDDATSELDGSRFEGRPAILASFRSACDLFDRRFDSRELRIVEGPDVRDGVVHVTIAATYTREGLPTLTLVGEESFRFAGDRIQEHIDHVLNAEEVMSYFACHAVQLRARGERSQAGLSGSPAQSSPMS